MSVAVVETVLASWVTLAQREDREAPVRICGASRSEPTSSSPPGSASSGSGSRAQRGWPWSLVRADFESARSDLFLVGVVPRAEGPVVPPVTASQDPVFLDEALAGPCPRDPAGETWPDGPSSTSVPGSPLRGSGRAPEDAPEGVVEAGRVLREALAGVGLDAGSAEWFASAAETVGALSTGRSVADLPPAGGQASGTGGDALPSGAGAGAEAAGLQTAARRVLDRASHLVGLRSRLDAALVRTSGELAVRTGALLLAGKQAATPQELSTTAHERWRTRTKSATRHDLAAATGWGPGEVADLVALGCAPAPVRAVVLSGMGQGLAGWGLVRRFWRECGSLSSAQAAHVAEVLLGSDPDVVAVERRTPEGEVSWAPWVHKEFYRALEREVTKILGTDPAACRQRNADARAARDARAMINDDGTAALVLTLTPTQSAAIIDRLHGAARRARAHGDPRTLAQLRADLAAALLLHSGLNLPDLPADPALVTPAHTAAMAAVLHGLPAATLNVIVPYSLLHHPSRAAPHLLPLGPHTTSIDPPPSDPPVPPCACPCTCTPTLPPGGTAGQGGSGWAGQALGVGEVRGAFSTFITADVVHDLLLTPGTTLHRLLVDPATGRCVERSTTAYQPDAAMRAQVMAADGACRAPGCTRVALYTQLDHVHEHGTGGPTAECNLECLCTVHHDLKTSTAWHAVIDPYRTVTWRTLLGRIYRTRTHDHRQYQTLLTTALTQVATTTGTLTATGTDPATATAAAIDDAIYTALAQRTPTDPLHAPDDDPWTSDQWNADTATTLTHTDPRGTRRQGPPPITATRTDHTPTTPPATSPHPQAARTRRNPDEPPPS